MKKIIVSAPARLLGAALLLVGVFTTACQKETAVPAGAVAAATEQNATVTYPYIGTLGNANDDATVKAIVNEISGFWGKYPRRLTITTATSIPNFLAEENKSLSINKNFFYEMKRKYPVDREFRLVLRGILAHEFGHLLQYTYVTNKNFYKDNRVSPELEADFIAGVYLGSIWGANYDAANLRTFMRFYNDYKTDEDVPVTIFDAAPMYGSSCQRASAASAGWIIAQRYRGPIVGGGNPVPNFALFRSTVVSGAIYSCLVTPSYSLPQVGSPFSN